MMKNNFSNSDRLSGSFIPGINRIVNLNIVIQGKSISHFKHFRLKQSARKHHDFELILAHDVLEEVQNHHLEDAQKFLGKRLTVTFTYKDLLDESPERTFVGVITKVAYSQEKGSLGNIVLKGQSPTILLDGAPHTQSFGGSQTVNTGIIADAIFNQALSSNLYDFEVTPQNNSYINYSSQYNETHYNYIARLAEAFGEQFFYDGEILHFGKLTQSEKPLRLVYGSSVNDVNVELKAIHTQLQYFGYNSSSNEKLTSADNNIRHLGDLAKNAYKINDDGIYKTKSLLPAPISPNMFKDVGDSQKSAMGSIAAEVLTVSGNTTIPFLYPSCVADIEMRKPDTNKTSYFTRLMITETYHEVDERGYYTGTFEAIAEGTGFLPKPEFHIPKAEPQIATVISNVDPLGQGRVQVRFDWQLSDTTHFIRVMSPDAGGTGAITQNRGFVAIPEIGDQVMVGFEYHNPSMPFVMGGMFHGGIGLGGGIDNHMKSIQTRSGIKVLMNDNERSVTIEDPSGNIYFMDGQGNINVTAPNKITMNATNIQMNATDIQMNAYNNLEMDVSNNVIINAMSKFFVFTPYMKNVVSGFMSFFSGKALFNSGSTLDIEAKEAKLHGIDKTIVHSDKQAIINSKGTAEMYGESGNQLSNQAKKMETTPSAKLVNTIVEFRTKQDGTYTGQFGFDWLRIDDNGATTEKAYIDCLENGYEARNGKYKTRSGKTAYRDNNTEYETKDEAFKALEKEYLQLPINRTSTPTLTKYYIPWLNLYPEAISTASTSAIKPPCEAELRVLVDVETEEPDQIRIVFDKRYFTIDGKDGTDANPVLITDKAIGAKRDTGQIIKIKCIGEFSTRQEIVVYGYPKDSLTKTVAEQLTLRKVVGKIALEPNKNTPKVGKKPAVKNRKELNVILVGVKTNILNITGNETTGTFDTGTMSGEKDSILKGLYQSLIEGKIIENDTSGSPLIVDVSANSAFQQKYNPTTGATIGSTYITTNDEIRANAHAALKTLFNRQTGNAYINDLLVFAFNEPGEGFVGVAEDIGKKSVVLVNTRNSKTLPHEALHSLGLYHTHRDAAIVYLDNTTPATSTTFNPNYQRNKDCIYVGTDRSLWMYNGTNYVAYVFHENMKPSKKFVYHHAHLDPSLATDNLMSYNGVLRKNTWHWQWKILKKSVK